MLIFTSTTYSTYTVLPQLLIIRVSVVKVGSGNLLPLESGRSVKAEILKVLFFTSTTYTTYTVSPQLLIGVSVVKVTSGNLLWKALDQSRQKSSK